ncbi:cysteine protease, putative [Medicago truncatula]|uniref:Cysteine protease, putative n=1 Tax=Medicago truncatula TaxID=3880 RepID=A0A072TXE6_MEDTR|nr:cysteine protease, putative [Medicago truncatula]
MTNMTIFMSLEYSCLRIYNVNDAKVIVIDRICTCSKLIFQPESNKHRTKTRNINTPHKNGKSKQTGLYRDDEITKTNERIQKICEITYSIRKEGKTIRRG